MWGTGVPVNGPAAATDAGREKLQQAARFERWAREAEVSLTIHIDERAPTGTDEPCRELRVPMMTLAEFRGTDLRRVTPRTENETTRTVSDRLRTLEREANPDEATTDRTNPTTGVQRPTKQIVSVLGGVDE